MIHRIIRFSAATAAMAWTRSAPGQLVNDQGELSMRNKLLSMQKRMARGIGMAAVVAALGAAQTAPEGTRPARVRPAAVKMQRPAANWTADSFAPMEMVKGAPYSAVKTIEGVKRTSDGKRIPETRPPFRIYRDSAGRERKEALPMAGAREMGASRAIQIDDPVEGVRYALDAASGVAHRIRVPVRPTRDSNAQRTFARPVSGPKQPRVESERLGVKQIEGVSVEGVRTVVTWPAGTVGNDKPRVITSEKWVSPDLKLVVLWRSSDPESSINETLTEIERKEPEASLFQIPPDYRIVDDESPQPMRAPQTVRPRI